MDEDIKVELDANLETKLHKFPVINGGSMVVAQKIAARAREMAPVQTGAYRDGIIAQKGNRDNGVWRVLATDNKSSWVEFGAPGANVPGQYVIRSAAESLGYTFKKSR